MAVVSASVKFSSTYYMKVGITIKSTVQNFRNEKNGLKNIVFVLYLNGTHQLLFYADDIDILGGSICYKEKRRRFSDC
jgi:hypothetical protein